MFAKPIVIALLTACGIHSGSAANPNETAPPEETEKDQQFCCTSVDPKTASGEGCVGISKENINSCSKLLSCGEKWTKDDGKVTCID